MESRDYRAIARENLADNWALSIGVAFVASLFSGLITAGGGGFNFNIDEEIVRELPRLVKICVGILSAIGGLLGLVSFILGGTVQLGYAQYLLKQYNRANFEFQDLFSQFHRIGQGFAQSFLRGLYIFLWSLLFVIPGIVKSFSYAMTPFIMAENPSLTASEAIEASKAIMEGHKMDLFLLDLSFIGWALLSALTLGIGNLALNPYMNAAHAAFYKNITSGNRIYE